MIPVTTRTEAAGPYDLVILSCKAYDLGASIDALRDAVGEGTLVLPLLNGMAHYDRLDAAFGAARVLGGIAFISAALAVDGRVRHLGKPAVLTLGARQPEQAEACERVAAALTVDRFALRRSEAIAQDAWEKFAFITAAASITCLMRAPVGDILRADDGVAASRSDAGTTADLENRSATGVLHWRSTFASSSAARMSWWT